MQKSMRNLNVLNPVSPRDGQSTLFSILLALGLFALILLSGCSNSNQNSASDKVASSASDSSSSSASETGDSEMFSVVLKAKTHGIIRLEDSAECKVSGGKSPYTFFWTIDGAKVDCDETCNFSLGVGNHTIICEVTDSKNQNSADQLIVRVERKRINIDKVVAFGDSITYGKKTTNPETKNWAYIYSRKIDAELENHAVSGDTSFGVLNQLNNLSENSTYNNRTLVFLWIGSNDVLRFIPLEDFKANYAEAVRTLSQKSSYLVLINIPDASKLKVTTDIESGVNDLASALGVKIDAKKIVMNLIQQYNQAIEEIANEYSVPVIDIFSYRESINDSMIADDGFHPNDAGQRLIEERIQEEMRNLFSDYEFI